MESQKIRSSTYLGEFGGVPYKNRMATKAKVDDHKYINGEHTCEYLTIRGYD